MRKWNENVCILMELLGKSLNIYEKGLSVQELND